MSRRSFYNYLSLEEDNFVSPDTNLEQEIVTDEVQTLEEEIDSVTDVITDTIEVSDDLQQQVDTNTEKLENGSEIVPEDVMASQESLMYAIGRLGISKDSFVHISKETHSTMRSKLQASNEDIGDVLNTIWEKIKAFFRWVWEKITNFFKAIARFFGFCSQEEKIVNAILDDAKKLEQEAKDLDINEAEIKELLNTPVEEVDSKAKEIQSNTKDPKVAKQVNTLKETAKAIKASGDAADKAIAKMQEASKELEKTLSNYKNSVKEVDTKKPIVKQTLKQSTVALEIANKARIHAAVNKALYLTNFENFRFLKLSPDAELKALNEYVGLLGPFIKEYFKYAIDIAANPNKLNINDLRHPFTSKFKSFGDKMQKCISLKPEKSLGSTIIYIAPSLRSDKVFAVHISGEENKLMDVYSGKAIPTETKQSPDNFKEFLTNMDPNSARHLNISSVQKTISRIEAISKDIASNQSSVDDLIKHANSNKDGKNGALVKDLAYNASKIVNEATMTLFDISKGLMAYVEIINAAKGRAGAAWYQKILGIK